jgi:predicted esterase
MRTALRPLGSLLLGSLLAACGGGGGSSSTVRYECTSVPSAAIGTSQVGNPSQGQLCALLPPSYGTSTRSYPVIYFLHGFGESPTQIAAWIPAMDATMAGGDEAIVVALQGRNQLQGGFYVDSDVTGRFETWVTQEAVAFVDAHYRTIPTAASRGLAGFSMGGFGAVNLGLRHPEIFQAVFAFAGGFLRPSDGLATAMTSWAGDPTFLHAYGATFAPNPSPPPAWRIPAMTGDASDLALQELWRDGFGNWDDKLDAYDVKVARLAALRVEWGTSDGYPWIPQGSAWLVNEMTANRGLTVESETHPLGHVLTTGVVQQCLMPFFLAHLTLVAGP